MDFLLVSHRISLLPSSVLREARGEANSGTKSTSFLSSSFQLPVHTTWFPCEWRPPSSRPRTAPPRRPPCQRSPRSSRQARTRTAKAIQIPRLQIISPRSLATSRIRPSTAARSTRETDRERRGLRMLASKNELLVFFLEGGVARRSDRRVGMDAVGYRRGVRERGRCG